MEINSLIDAIGCIDDEMILSAKNNKFKIKYNKRIVAVAIAVFLLISISVPVFATTLSPIYNFLYYISPSLAQAIKPIKLSCEDNGIKMEVVSSAVFNDEIAFYISIEDTTGKNRIDKTTDLFDSYHIKSALDSTASCSMLSFDDNTGVATFLITIKQWYGKEISRDKITFFFTQILSNKDVFEGELTSDILQNISEVVKTQRPSSFRGGGGKDFDFEERNNINCLVPIENGICSPVDGVTVTNAGFIDGKLHIQLYFENIKMFDNHGYIELVDNNGKNADCYNLSFWDEKNVGSYEEIIYDITPEQLKDYKAFGHFVTCDTLIEGRWEVTFSQDSIK